MKKIITLLLILFSSICFSQTVDSTKITETERIIDKYSGKIADSFTQGLEKVTPIAEDGFKIAVKVSIAQGIGLLLPSLLFIIFFSLLCKEYSRLETILMSDDVPSSMDCRHGPYSEYNFTGILSFYTIFTGLSAIASAFTIYDGILHLIAPEWYAIINIIELFK